MITTTDRYRMNHYRELVLAVRKAAAFKRQATNIGSWVLSAGIALGVAILIGGCS